MFILLHMTGHTSVQIGCAFCCGVVVWCYVNVSGKCVFCDVVWHGSPWDISLCVNHALHFSFCKNIVGILRGCYASWPTSKPTSKHRTCAADADSFCLWPFA